MMVRMFSFSKTLLGLLAWLCSTSSIVGAQQASPEVLLKVNNQWQGFSQAPRLSLLLQSVPNSSALHWPSAKLFRLSQNPQLEQLRKDVSEQLRQLTLTLEQEPQLASQLMKLRSEMLLWQLAEPVTEQLDPTLALTQVRHNPVIPEGQYVLSARPARNRVYFVGIGGDMTGLFQPGLAAYSYTDILARPELGSPETVWLLKVDGTIQQIPVAFYNRSNEPLPLEAVVFVPMPKALLGDKFANLNQQLVELLQHRVMP